MNFLSSVRHKVTALLASASILSVPFLAQAHEVYVLSPDAIAKGMTEPSLDVFGIITEHLNLFSFWAFIAVLVVVSVFFFSISKKVEQAVDPFLLKIKRYAPLVARLTVGASFMFAAYHGAFMAPEFSLEGIGGENAGFLAVLLAIAGALIFWGVLVRTGALIGLGFFALAVTHHGSYLITYADYLGAIIFLILVGGHEVSLERVIHASRELPPLMHRVQDRIYKFGMEYGFTILRVGLGISLIYASYYAKYLHAGLAMQTVDIFGLAQVFGFEPSFLVLGAFILEVLLGVFFIIGFEIRFAVLFAATFLTLSQLYFKEAVWPHGILFGVAIALFMHGYDKYSLEGYFFKKGKREPVL